MTATVETLPTEEQPKKKLVPKIAERYGVDDNKLLSTLTATCFKIKDRAPTEAELVALLVVADQYKLNPFTKEIFAFPDKQKGIVPVVSVDGWSRIINEHPAMDGIEFRYADEHETPDGGKSCPIWCEAVIYRKDRSHPIVVREYLDEVYREAFKLRSGDVIKGPWQSHTKRFLRHKALIQAARIAFGFAGIYDHDEAENMIDITPGADIPERPQKADFEQKPDKQVDGYEVPDAEELYELLNDAGEVVGVVPRATFVEGMLEMIKEATDIGLLEALWEHNADARYDLGGRSAEVQAISQAYNGARENLMADKRPAAKKKASAKKKSEPEEGPKGEEEPQPKESSGDDAFEVPDEPKPPKGETFDDEDTAKAWCQNFVQAIRTMPDRAGINAHMARHAATIEHLRGNWANTHATLVKYVNEADTKLAGPDG